MARRKKSDAVRRLREAAEGKNIGPFPIDDGKRVNLSAEGERCGMAVALMFREQGKKSSRPVSVPWEVLPVLP
jgi:hypothetical protein